MKYSADSQLVDDPGADIGDVDISRSNMVARTIHLYRMLLGAGRVTGDSSGLQQLLTCGCRQFSLDYALLIRRLSQQVAEVCCAVAPDGEEETYFVGQHLPLENTPTASVFDTKSTVSFRKGANIGDYPDGFAYNGVGINVYLGAWIQPSTSDPMALCLFSSTGKRDEFSSQDIEIIGLLAEGVAFMVDLQKSQAQRKLTDQAMLALGSVKTLEEYLQQARLPEVYGVPARVVEVLQRRVGHAPLSIGHIADELNLSKRTLQRRLQQQDISFADLRDQVRFHHSIDYLIKQHLSIDSISASLDFSDRTSFTNAFKRWTGLSPSAFRKLFRDYV